MIISFLRRRGLIHGHRNILFGGGGTVDPHPGNNLLLESGFNILLEQGSGNALLLEQ